VSLLGRLGRLWRFDPTDRTLRVWVRSRPGEDDAEVVRGWIRALEGGEARLELERPVTLANGETVDAVWVRPTERRFDFAALWFSFIAVEVRASAGDPPQGRWWLRLGAPDGRGGAPGGGGGDCPPTPAAGSGALGDSAAVGDD